MEKLTKKELANAIKTNTYIEYNKSQYKEMPKPTYEELYLKVNAIEEIQEELGIPLEVLFKALKDGAYMKMNNKLWQCKNLDFYYSICDKEYRLEAYSIINIEKFETTYETSINIKDYGKTWSLTREELESAKD